MPQQHLERLTSTDASFLHQEGHSSHMHIGGVLIFEGPPPAFDDYLRHLRSRLHLVPRYRQKLATPPLETGRPLWVDDPNFNLEYHMRHAALPSPGTEQQLFQLVGRIVSQPLDRSKPLWESWLVEGLEDDRFALISKTHHSLVDGVSGVDLATVLLDHSREPAPVPTDLEPWQPKPEPSPAELVFAGVRGIVTTSAEIALRALTAAHKPATSFAIAREAAEGLGEIVWAGLNPAPATPLNIEIGPHRRYAIVRQRLSEYKEIKDALSGTVNDVVLTVVSGALARWLRSRGVRTEGLEMRALVPVSVRTKHDQGTLGNRLSAMRGPLPVYISDPVARLQIVRTAMDGLKGSKQAVGAATLAAVNNLAPPTVLAQASRLNFSTRLFNLLVTNIPGPQVPLYVLGRELLDLFPVAFLPKDHALAIAIMSYNGAIDYGLLGDYDALPDIDLLAEGIDNELAELLSAARTKAGATAAGARAEAVSVADSLPAPALGPTPAAKPARKPAPSRKLASGPAAKPTPAAVAVPPATPAPASAGAPAPSADPTPNGGPAPIIPSSRARASRGPAADMRAKRARSHKQPRA
jgi:WS/DGAT/MGAT family acyltransferase